MRREKRIRGNGRRIGKTKYKVQKLWNGRGRQIESSRKDRGDKSRTGKRLNGKERDEDKRNKRVK